VKPQEGAPEKARRSRWREGSRGRLQAMPALQVPAMKGGNQARSSQVSTVLRFALQPHGQKRRGEGSELFYRAARKR